MVLISCNQLRLMSNYIVWHSVIAVSLQYFPGARLGMIGIFLGASFMLTASWILPRHVFGMVRGDVA